MLTFPSDQSMVLTRETSAEVIPLKAVRIDSRIIEERIKSSSDYFKAVVESSGDAIIGRSLDGTIVSWNEGARKIFGYSEEEIIGRSMRFLFPQRRLDQETQAMERIAQGEQLETFEAVRIRKDRTKVFVSVAVSPIFNAFGKIVGTVATVRDIALRKKIDDEILQAVKRISYLLAASSLLHESFDSKAQLKRLTKILVPAMADWCAIDVLGTDGIIRRAAALHTDKRLVERIFELDRRYPAEPDSSDGTYQVLTSGKSQLMSEITEQMLRQSTKDEEHFSLMEELGTGSAMIVPLVTKSRAIGVIICASGKSNRKYSPEDLKCLEDISKLAASQIEITHLLDETRKLNADLNGRARKQAAEIDDLNKNFEVAAELLLGKQPKPDSPFDMREWTKQSNVGSSQDSQLQSLMTKFNFLLKIHRHKLNKTKVKTDVLLKEVMDELSQDIRDRSISWKIYSLPEVHADHDMLKFVFNKLLSNSLKYTKSRAKAEICIGYLHRGTENIFVFEDNGVGFDKDGASKLFEAFNGLNNPMEFQGKGIGLASVRKIIEDHGGKTWAEGRPGIGATIYFSLPCEN